MSKPMLWTHEALFRFFANDARADVECQGELYRLGTALEYAGLMFPRFRREFVWRCTLCGRFVFVTAERKVFSLEPTDCSLARPRRPRP